MKILIGVGGLTNGFWSTAGGEARHAINIADMLSDRDHEVHCYGTGHHGLQAPQWGVQPPKPGVRMVSIKDLLFSPIEYDAFINAPRDWNGIQPGWQQCKSFPVITDKLIHVQFSWNQQMEDYVESTYGCTKEHIIALPYDPIPEESYTQNSKIYLLPTPFYKDLSIPDISNRREVVWLNKDVFSDVWPEERSFHRPALRIMQALEILSKEIPELRTNFASTWSFGSTNRSKNLGIESVYKNIRINEIRPKADLRYDQVHTWMKRSRIAIVLPGFFAGAWDAIGNGTAVLFFKESHGIRDRLGDTFCFDNDVTVEELCTEIRRVLTDDEYYQEVVDKQRQGIGVHSYDNSYKYFLELMK